MEQPEIHLHPAVQSGLADVMLNVAKVRNVQILVESHSEHLMRRLQRRVAEGSASAEDIKLYFVNFRRGKAHVSNLELNEWVLSRIGLMTSSVTKWGRLLRLRKLH